MIALMRQRNIFLVLTCCLIFGCVLSLSLLLVPLYTLALSDSPLVLSLVMAVFPLTGALLSLAGGLLGDYFGRRAIMIGGFVCFVGACLVYAIASSPFWLLMGQILLGLGDVTFFITAWAYLSEMAPPGRQMALQGLANGVSQVGMIFGPFVGGHVADLGGFRPAFLLAGALAGLGFIIATRIQRTEGLVAHADSLVASFVAYHKGAWRLLVENPAVLWACALFGIALCTWPAMGNSFYLAFLDVKGFSPSGAGTLISAQLLIGTVAQLALGQLGNLVSVRNLALAATAVGAVTLGATPLLAGVPWIVFVGCIGGVSAVYFPVLVGFVADSTDIAKRSMAVALLNLAWAIMTPCALFVIAVAVQQVSLSFAFFLVGGAVLFSCALLWSWARNKML